jgi:HD-GYP domain-containing protein (c-di-GMP phosphodiesterase class II)
MSVSMGTVLAGDLFAADGTLIASRGEVVDLRYLKEVATRSRPSGRERPLHETALAEAVLEAFEEPALAHLVGSDEARACVADAVCEIRFPQAIWDELELLRREDPARYQHAVWTSMIAARLFHAALGAAPGLSRLAGGALVHDIGMRHTAARLRSKRDHLTRGEARALEDHPLLGALTLASSLGDAPAVHFALLHHTRAGLGYPRVAGRPPLRGLDLVSVSSAFAALLAPRSWRQQAFNPRGAADQLLDEALAGHFDVRAVRLLIHGLRGARGAFDELQLPQKRTGFRPSRNHHGVAPAEAASA